MVIDQREKEGEREREREREREEREREGDRESRGWGTLLFYLKTGIYTVCTQKFKLVFHYSEVLFENVIKNFISIYLIL